MSLGLPEKDATGDAAIIFANRFFFPDHSATSQMVSDLAFHLAGKGRRVRVIASRGIYDDPSALLPEFETINGVEIHRVSKPRFGRSSIAGRAADYLAMYKAFAAAAARIGRAGDFLVAKTDPPLLSVALAPVARLKNLKLVNWLQDLYPEVALGLGMNSLKLIAPLLTALRDASLRAATTNVSIGEIMDERLTKIGIDANRRVIIPNWCNDQKITAVFHQDNRLRHEWGLDEKFVVGYSGNLGRAHEYQTILDAAERLREHTDIVFLFVGGGHLTGPLKADVAARKLDSFLFRPYQDAEALPLSLTLPDVHWLSLEPAMEGLIVPSKFYGIAAAGRPTIAVTAGDGEIARLAPRYDCGIQVTPGDGAAFAAQILALQADRGRLKAMGENARRMIDEHYSRRSAFENWGKALSDQL